NCTIAFPFSINLIQFFCFILKSQIQTLFFKKKLMVEFRHSDRHTANLQGAKFAWRVIPSGPILSIVKQNKMRVVVSFLPNISMNKALPPNLVVQTQAATRVCERWLKKHYL